MTDTLHARMVAARIDPERARHLIVTGAVRMNGEVVDNPGAEAPWPASWCIGPS